MLYITSVHAVQLMFILSLLYHVMASNIHKGCPCMREGFVLEECLYSECIQQKCVLLSLPTIVYVHMINPVFPLGGIINLGY